MLSLKRGDKAEVSVTVTNETFLRLAVLTVGTVLFLLAVNKAAHSLLLIFIAFFLALALNGPVHWLSQRLPSKKENRRVLATSLSYFIIILLLGGFLASLTPPLVRETRKFIDMAPERVQSLTKQDSQLGRLIREYDLEKQVDKVSDQLKDNIGNIGGTAVSSLQRIGNSAFALLTILVLSFMMLIEGPRWLAFSRDVVPDKHSDRFDRLTVQMYQVVRGFVNGQVILAAMAAVAITPVLFLLNVSYPLALMVVVFIAGLIPMVGHTIGAILVSLVALFESPSAALIILIYYILYQQLENILIQPRIQANSTNMSPLLVFMSVVIGVSFGGLVGGLLAIPVAGCLRIVVLEYLHHKEIIKSSTYREAVTDTK